MHYRRLARLIKAMEVGHRRVQREEAVEWQCQGLPVQCQGLVAAQLDPVGIADRCDYGQPVERAAENDRQEARIAALRACPAGDKCPREQCA